MAANYWASTQSQHWQSTQEALRESEQKLDMQDQATVQQYPLPQKRLLYIYLQQRKLGRRLSTRQPVLATAFIYVRRFYSKVAIRKSNPYMILATAFYLACKIEECPQHIRVVVSEAKNLWPDLIQADTSRLGECEFWMISELSAQLIIHHPYRTLDELQKALNLSQDEIGLAWSIVNDHYVTSLPLIFPPHIVAVAATTLAMSIRAGQGEQQNALVGQPSRQYSSATASSMGLNNHGRAEKLKDLLSESTINMESVVDSVQEMISLYVVWDQYSEKVCKEQMAKFVKGLGLER